MTKYILQKAGSVLGSTRNNTGENNPMFGKNHSDDTRKKISDAMTGKNHTEETKIIMSEAKKGKPKVEGSGSPSQQI